MIKKTMTTMCLVSYPAAFNRNCYLMYTCEGSSLSTNKIYDAGTRIKMNYCIKRRNYHSEADASRECNIL